MYRVFLSKKFRKNFKKLDRSAQKLIYKWMESNLFDCKNPRIYGKALTANLSEYWRYRVGKYRIIAEIKDEKLIIVALTVGHRKEIYEF